jgi:hypothetical protein
MSKAKDISEALKGKKVLVKTNFDVDVELAIDCIRSNDADKRGAVRVHFENRTFEDYQSIFDVRFV